MRSACRKKVRREVPHTFDPRHLFAACEWAPCERAPCERAPYERESARTVPVLSVRQPVSVKQWFREELSSVKK